MSHGHPTIPRGAARPGELERLVSTLLRVGLLLSLGTVAIGLAWLFAGRPDDLLSPERLAVLTARGARFPHHVRQVASDLAHGDAQAIVAAGLVLLILTPVMRVTISLVEFIRARDRAFTLITAGVLAVLLLSLLMRAGG